jgi:Lrp/AsnC family transcriptional regulator
MTEIVEAHRLSGDTDYLLRIVVPDIREYDRVYQKLIRELEFLDVSSSFSMEELKSTTALPVKHA